MESNNTAEDNEENGTTGKDSDGTDMDGKGFEGRGCGGLYKGDSREDSRREGEDGSIEASRGVEALEGERNGNRRHKRKRDEDGLPEEDDILQMLGHRNIMDPRAHTLLEMDLPVLPPDEVF